MYVPLDRSSGRINPSSHAYHAACCHLPNTNDTRLTYPRAIDEKQPQQKQILRSKACEYMDRSEKLKEYLDSDTTKKKPSAVGTNGSASGTGAKGKCVPPVLILH